MNTLEWLTDHQLTENDLREVVKAQLRFAGGIATEYATEPHDDIEDDCGDDIRNALGCAKELHDAWHSSGSRETVELLHRWSADLDPRIYHRFEDDTEFQGSVLWVEYGNGGVCEELANLIIRIRLKDKPTGDPRTELRTGGSYDRYPDSLGEAAVRQGVTLKELGMPYWEAVPGGRKCPICAEVISTPGTKLNQAVYDHWATHEPTDADECADGCHHGDADDDDELVNVDPAVAALARKVAEALEAGGTGPLGETERVIIYRTLRDNADSIRKDA